MYPRQAIQKAKREQTGKRKIQVKRGCQNDDKTGNHRQHQRVDDTNGGTLANRSDFGIVIPVQNGIYQIQIKAVANMPYRHYRYTNPRKNHNCRIIFCKNQRRNGGNCNCAQGKDCIERNFCLDLHIKADRRAFCDVERSPLARNRGRGYGIAHQRNDRKHQHVRADNHILPCLIYRN